MNPDSDHRLLQFLQQLLDLPAFDLKRTLTAAATYVATWFGCDKVDVFLLDEARASLAAVGTSETPLGNRQKALGLDVLPLANGGRLVDSFQAGTPFRTGRADLDELELVGIVRDLGVRSQLSVPLAIGGARRGVLSVVAQQPDRFSEHDLKLLEVIGLWLGALAHRAELSERVQAEEGARARTAAAEQILTVLSHDIRNHLSPLSGRLLLLQQKLRRGEPPDPAALDPALAAVKRLSRLTNSWLDLSRLDQGLFELELEAIDVCALLRETVEALATASVPIEIEASSELVVLGDRERLTQAFENVIANGLRYSPAGRPLRVVLIQQRDRNVAVVRVVDEGPGIPPALLPHLFERFVSSRPSRGIGLGLHLAERVLAAHGGSLRVESELGAGACFEFELPCEGPIAPMGARSATLTQATSRLRPPTT
jgi:two-component system OmpR family sensor kinase